MASQDDYRVGTAALSVVIAAAIKANVPESLEWAVEQKQALIDHLEQQGAKAVVDAVDANRAKATT